MASSWSSSFPILLVRLSFSTETALSPPGTQNGTFSRSILPREIAVDEMLFDVSAIMTFRSGQDFAA